MSTLLGLRANQPKGFSAFSKIDNKVKRVIDVRLRPYGQLAGFAKKKDLEFFLHNLINCDYVHLPQLAPTNEILKSYRDSKDWDKYVSEFTTLMVDRNIPEALNKALFEDACLLCSEAEPDYCHRRLIAETLQANWIDVAIHHLG